jgi:hypothetical protein
LQRITDSSGWRRGAVALALLLVPAFASGEPAPEPSPAERFQRSLGASGSAFSAVEQQSPLQPLGQSATELRERMIPGPAGRRWQAALTGGLEGDSDPVPFQEVATAFAAPGAEGDGRGVLRARASVGLLDAERGSLTLGYDGFVTLHFDETQANLQMHSAWAAGGVNLGPVRLGLQADYAYEMTDTTEPFRHLVLGTPSAGWRQADWALGVLFYQYQWSDLVLDTMRDSPVLDGDGGRHLAGLYQFFFLPEPFTWVRIGGFADLNRSDGTEWEYDGFEVSMGCGYDFDYGVALTWLYRFKWQDYLNPSDFAEPGFVTSREDRRHILSVDLRKSLTEHLELSVAASFSWNGSNLSFYEGDRQFGGAYLSYRF